MRPAAGELRYKMAAATWPRHHGCRRLAATRSFGPDGAPPGMEITLIASSCLLSDGWGQKKKINLSRPSEFLGSLLPEGIVLLVLECSPKPLFVKTIFSSSLGRFRLEVLGHVVIFKYSSCLTGCNSTRLMAI